MAGVTIDTNNGAATNWTGYTGFTMASGTSARISSYNSAFWRVELTKTGTAAAHDIVFFPAATTNATQSTGAQSAAVTGSAVFYGAMVNLGAFAGPYIPTSTIAVARNSDLLTYTGADVAGSGDFTFYAEVARGFGTNNETIVEISDGTVNEREVVYIDTAGKPTYGVVDGGVGQASLVNGSAITVGTVSKIAFVAATNNFKLEVNAGAIQADTAGTMPTVTTLRVGGSVSGTTLNAPIRNLRRWNRALSSSELQAITS
jgi:hypothetical protein